MDIKETREVLAALKAFAVEAKDIMADGKVNIMDIPKLAVLWTPFKDAFEGANLVAAELKDLDTAEIQQLLTDVVDVGLAVANIFQPAA